MKKKRVWGRELTISAVRWMLAGENTTALKFGVRVRTYAHGNVVFKSWSPATGFDCVGAEPSWLIGSSHGRNFDARRIE